MATMTINIRLPVTLFRENGVHVAQCPILDVASQGETEEEAMRNIHEAITLFIKTCFELGTLDEVLKECGFRPVHGTNHETEDIGNMIDIALPFSAVDNDRECRA